MVFLLHGWSPDGTYSLPCRQIAWRFNRITRQKALTELVQAGFFDILDPGGFYPRRSAVFKLSDRWKARSRALIADEAAGKAQGKLGWIPNRPHKLAPPRLFTKVKAKKARPTKRAAVEKADLYLKAKNGASGKSASINTRKRR
jgi:hypothetical protein